MRTSHDLRQWRNAHEQAQRQAPEQVAAWIEEREWLYSLLSPEDRAAADKIAKAAKDRHRARVAETSLCRWVGERMRAYDALSPEDKVTADRYATFDAVVWQRA